MTSPDQPQVGHDQKSALAVVSLPVAPQRRSGRGRRTRTRSRTTTRNRRTRRRNRRRRKAEEKREEEEKEVEEEDAEEDAEEEEEEEEECREPCGRGQPHRTENLRANLRVLNRVDRVDLKLALSVGQHRRRGVETDLAIMPDLTQRANRREGRE